MTDTADDRHFSRQVWFIATLTMAVAMAVTGFALNRYYVQQEVEAHAQKFELLSSLRRNAILDYFDTLSTEISFWALNDELLGYQRQISKRMSEFKQENGDPSTVLRQVFITENPFPEGQRGQYLGPKEPRYTGAYTAFHENFHPFARRFVTERNYYDMFLISPKGDIFYSVEKEDDFATNLIEGPYRHTGLGWVYREAVRQSQEQAVVFSDIEAYEPSNFESAMFMGKALLDEQGELLGVLAFQLPMDRLQSMMRSTAAMGESGETFIVGEDLLMRSDSRFSDVTTVLETTVDTPTVAAALAGEQGVTFIDDYRGVEVLSAYTSLDLGDIRWAVLAEIDRAEILQQMADKRPQFAGVLLLIFGMGLWSLWFIRPGDWKEGASFGGLGSSGGDGDYGD